MKYYLEQSYTFAEYLELIDDLLLREKTTGPNQSDEMFNYAKLNRQRMKRLMKTVKLDDSLIQAAKNVNKQMIWLTITEGWCGDAAQAIPVIEKIAAETDLIETRYLLRDENLELMDRYLTKGGRSIPKLILLDAETLEEIGVWGPRPQAAVNYFNEMRESGMEKPQMMENLQRWYLANREQAIQQEFEEILSKWQSTNLTAPVFADANTCLSSV